MDILAIGGALYGTIALAAMARTVREARQSGRVTPLGLCAGLLLCLAWLPVALVFLAWPTGPEDPDR